jgi:hypothetical protein
MKIFGCSQGKTLCVFAKGANQLGLLKFREKQLSETMAA